MSEKLSNHSETDPHTSPSTQWDELQQVPFNAHGAESLANHENDAQKYETELTSPDAILNDIQQFSIKEGKVYSKTTGQEELDEDTILRVKTSRLLFNTAKEKRDFEQHALGKRFKDRGPEFYIDGALERYGFKDDNPKFAEGKMLKKLVDSGMFQENTFANNLENSKFNMFIGKKGDLGRALLQRRLKQHGLAMNSLNINIDTSNFQRDGVSTVDIHLETSPLAQPTNDSAPQSPDNPRPNHPQTLHHPAAAQLSQLEKGLAEAQKNHDETAINGYHNALKMVIERNRLEVTPEEWQNMNHNQRERFLKLKMKEEKILGNQDAYNYWHANLEMLQSQQNQQNQQN